MLRLGYRFRIFRSFQTCAHLNAGHNKWSNIKHTKASKDAARSIVISKFCMRLKKCLIKGDNPETNLDLAKLLIDGKKLQVPANTIKNLFLLRQKRLDSSQVEYIDVMGPENTFLIVESFTNNKRRTIMHIRKIIKSAGGRIADEGGLAFHFELKGTVSVDKIDCDLNLEQLTDVAIEVNAENVEENEYTYEFICQPNDVNSVKEKLEKTLTLTDLSFKSIHTAKNKITLQPDKLDVFNFVIESLMENEDIVNVVHNVKGL
ncbi:Coiled-coil domain-containing protein 44 [Intoshia linei]|uniref:Coiled-coil domain-containing protein 44 n=1 Tax=Intoshia linei TaxID=1819745 RepID=A0A177B4P4_9BILA|nr:Coiled-coil domain-containing protein 44 [Intoshia linei]